MTAHRHPLDHPALDRVLFVAWLLVCGLLPVDGGWVPIPLLITIVLGLVLAVHRKPSFHWKLLWPLFAFYALHVIGMAWTTDTAFGLFDLQVKLGFVLLPIVASVLCKQRKDLLRLSMIAFTLGAVMAIVFGLHKAWNCHGLTGLANCFSQSTLSYALHPSYAAWYGCWCVAYWGHQLLVGAVQDKRLRTAVLIVLPLVLLFTVMLASKSGVVGLTVTLALLLLAALIKLRGIARFGIAVLVIGMVGVAFAAQGPLLIARMQAARAALGKAWHGDPSIYASAEGSALRTVAWICSVERLQAEPMGAGTGDIKHALMDCYQSKSAIEAASRKLNSHGQFLQAGVALGWLGLLLFVLTLLIPLFHGFRAKHVLLIQFTLLVVVNAAVESVLEVQAGVVFFGFFFGTLVAELRTSDPSRTGTEELA